MASDEQLRHLLDRWCREIDSEPFPDFRPLLARWRRRRSAPRLGPSDTPPPDVQQLSA